MFLEEARLSALMNHPNVVQVYEVFLQRNVPVIVMEFLDGQPLNSILARAGNGNGPSLELAISILSKVLAGLHYAHTLHDLSGEPLGLIHRDVSPHNVMVTHDGQVKLIDFGIAKLARSEHRTRTGVVKGKLTYMAPEQFTGTTDHRADIFGVGVMLWEFAARRRYWGDLLEPAIIGRLVSGQLPHLQTRTEMDVAVWRICERALAPRAEDRYATAAEMQSDLERYLAARGLVITQRAIGEFVTQACADDRMRVQADIRGQLSAHGLSWTESGDGLVSHRIRPKPSPREAALRALSEEATRELAPSPEVLREASASASGERLAGAASNEGAPLRLFGGATPMARSVVAIAGFGTVAVLVFALGLGTSTPNGGQAAGQSTGQAVPPQRPVTATGALEPAAPEPRSTPASPAAARIRIAASAQPKAARWYLDGVEMQSNPLQTSAARDLQWHTLRAEADGFEPFVKKVQFDANIDVTVVLAPR
jgi:serine/threonine-protein kinase